MYCSGYKFCSTQCHISLSVLQMNTDLLKKKSGLLDEYFCIHVDAEGNLGRLPVILDQYTPEMDRVPEFVLCLGNDVRFIFLLLSCLSTLIPFLIYISLCTFCVSVCIYSRIYWSLLFVRVGFFFFLLSMLNYSQFHFSFFVMF